MVVSPSKTFSIFSNSSLYHKVVKKQRSSLIVPNQMTRMTLFEFMERSKKGKQSDFTPLFYKEEYYYFQSEPPAKPLKRLKASGPLSCSKSRQGKRGTCPSQALCRRADGNGSNDEDLLAFTSLSCHLIGQPLSHMCYCMNISFSNQQITFFVSLQKLQYMV